MASSCLDQILMIVLFFVDQKLKIRAQLVYLINLPRKDEGQESYQAA